MTTGLTLSRQSIALHSKSFALASRLLPADGRDDAAIVYAWCRQADDAIDLVPPSQQAPALSVLRSELASVYAGEAQADPVLAAFQGVVTARGIPRKYPDELLAGMEMDVAGAVYADFDALLEYCYRVAGTVGLMMSHVMGVREEGALRHAAHLGMAMQLTNVCRDVREDWERGRLYLPDDLLAAAGARDLRGDLGAPLPTSAVEPIADVTLELLRRADRFYESGDLGIPMLSRRSALAVRTARLVYSDIGRVVQSRGGDPLAPRAVVSLPRKLWLASRAALRTLLDVTRPFQAAPLRSTVGFRDVVSV
jgi:phytoene synthase